MSSSSSAESALALRSLAKVSCQSGGWLRVYSIHGVNSFTLGLYVGLYRIVLAGAAVVDLAVVGIQLSSAPASTDILPPPVT